MQKSKFSKNYAVIIALVSLIAVGVTACVSNVKQEQAASPTKSTDPSLQEDTPIYQQETEPLFANVDSGWCAVIQNDFNGITTDYYSPNIQLDRYETGEIELDQLYNVLANRWAGLEAYPRLNADGTTHFTKEELKYFRTAAKTLKDIYNSYAAGEIPYELKDKWTMFTNEVNSKCIR